MSKLLTVDCHVDTLWVNTGKALQKIPTVTPTRMDFGGLDRVVLALYLNSRVQDSHTEATIRQMLWTQVYAAGIRFPGRHFIAMEGGRLLGSEPVKQLGEFAEIGIKYLTLTHNENIAWAGSSTDNLNTGMGLNRTGEDVVRACERWGVLVDISHCSERTVEDVFRISTKPVIASHSGAKHVLDHVRNLTDIQILAIAQTGGVVHVPFAHRFVHDRRGIIEHIDHIAQLTSSVEHVGIGSDLDGAAMVTGMTGAESWSNMLVEPLLNRGYSDECLEKILGGNTLRVFNEAEAAIYGAA